MSESMRFPVPAERLIPHRPPMQLIEALEAFDGEGGTVSARVAPDNPLLEEDGALSEIGLLELLAQGYAAVKGYSDSLSGKPVQQGFLVGVRKFSFFSRPNPGDKLEVHVRTTASLENFAIVEGSVRRGGEILAQGRIKLWIVPGEENTK